MTPTVLLTDFGLRDAYVGMMKGVIAGIAPEALVIDLSHQVAPQNVREATFSLFVSYRYFPSGTVFCCVVDPGVGSARRAVALKIRAGSAGPYTLVGPDNGIFTGALFDTEILKAVSIENPKYQLSEVSHTFHGRDIFAPVAAHLAAGVALEELGPKLEPHTLHRLDWTAPREKERGWEVDTLHADHFGNLITNLPAHYLKPDVDKWQVKVDRFDIGPVRRTFADVRVGHPLAYVGSSGFLELAIRDGNAREQLSLKEGSVITVMPVKNGS